MMRRPATLCAVLTFGLLALIAPLAPARAVDGALDPTFGTLGMTRAFFDLGTTDEDRGYDVAVDALDRIVVVGIVDVAGVKRWGVTRLLPNGAVDTSFSVGGVPGDGKLVLDTYVADPVHPPVVAVWDRQDDDPDLRNDIVLAGGVIEGNKAAFCAVNAEGSGFACGQPAGTPGWYVDIELRGSSVYLGGTIDAGGTDRDFFIERRLTTAFPWPRDASFGSGGFASFFYDVPGGTGRDELNAIEVTADGEIILAGSRSNAAGEQELFWMKLNPTATATVYEGFKSLFPGADHLACGLAVATDESFYISGSVVGPGIDGGEMHYVLSGGSWSTGFHNTLIAGGYNDVVLQPDGKPVIIAPGDGTSPGFRFRRRLAGSLDLDPSFSGGQVEYPFTDGPGADVSLGRSLALQNGRILAVGEAEWNDPDFDFGILRLESSPIFFDGFATGGLSAWSSVAP